MRYLWINYLVHEEDDPTESYVELDENRLERRRADLYDNGMAFAYGDHPGDREILSKEPVTMAVLGDMGELGDFSREGHRQMGELLSPGAGAEPAGYDSAGHDPAGHDTEEVRKK